MMSSETDKLEPLITILEAAWEAGCPVAGSTPEARFQIEDVARRFIQSLSRRSSDTSSQAAIHDLANGLIGQLEPDRKEIGPLTVDYRWLAAQLLTKNR